MRWVLIGYCPCVLPVVRSIFLVEEFVDGGTLKTVVAKQMLLTQHQYSMRDAVRWLIGIARGLKYLHQREPMVRGRVWIFRAGSI